MVRRRRLLLAVALTAGALLWCFSPLEAEPQPVKKSAYEATVQPFLAKHCYSCHGADKQSGKLRLDNLAADFDSTEGQAKWIEVMDRINLGEMPPDGEPRPDVKDVRSVAGWVAGELRSAAKRSLSRGGEVPLRRMNRTEYTNTIRDLLGMTFLPGESPLEFLPPDGTAEGFDKVGAALTLDPSLLDKYYEVSLRIADRAIVTGPPPFPTSRVRYEYEETATHRAISYQCERPNFLCREQDVVVMEGGARSFGKLLYGKTGRMIPTKGVYAIRVRASADPSERGEPIIMRINRGDELIGETVVEARPDAPKVYEYRVALDEPGGNELGVALVNGTKFGTVQREGLDLDRAIDQAGKAKDFAEVMRLRSRRRLEGITNGKFLEEVLDPSKLPKLILDWVEVEGPLYEQWPPTSHASLFFKPEKTPKDLTYAREIFERFLPRAYRRPVGPDEIAVIVGLVDEELKLGTTFEDAIRVGLSAVLTSPKFLYLAEPSGNETRTLTEYELASRLSYFLWSSMPDDALFALARDGKLSDPAVRRVQVKRMLGDPKASALVDGFAAQWLRTGEFRRFQPDPKYYKDYTEKLGESMARQPLTFFEQMLRNDGNLLAFLDSDWTVVDERLANYYGIAGVKGDEFRRVMLPAGSPRGGLLGMAGIAMWGSDGTRTKPVSRGVYVREVLFNDPPDPPPPNVGEIEPNIQGENLTVRERLIQHQQIESCAACHRGIDAYGLALENFNVIGQWRDRQDGEGFSRRNAPPIDASGRLPNGGAFKDYAEFRKLIAVQKDRFARGFTEKLFVYALGRPVEPSDRETIDTLAAGMEAHGFTLKGLIQDLVAAPVFGTK